MTEQESPGLVKTATYSLTALAIPKLWKTHAQREEVVAAREAGSGKSERYSSTLSEKTIYFARLLEDGTVLRVSNTQSSMVSLLLDMSEPMIFIIVAAVLVSMFLAYRIARKIVQPINEMDLEHPMENQT